MYSALHLLEEMLSGLEGRTHDKQGLLATALFVRLREFAKASSTLLLYGQQNSASVQLRALFEVVVYLKNCCERPDFESEFVGSTLKSLRKMAQVGIDNPGGLLSEEQSRGWSEKKLAVEERLALNGPAQPSLEVLARRVGLEAWYAYFYRMGSFHAHSSFISLILRHINFGSDGEMSIEAGPKDTEFRRLASTLVEYVLISADSLLKLYDLGVTEKLEELRQQHHLIASKDLARMRQNRSSPVGR